MTKEHVLVVDDDMTQAEALVRLLNLERDIEATAVDSAAAALNVIEKNPPDLVLTDLKMPGMDGLELYRQVRQRSAEMPVMIMTAHGTIETAIEAVRLGVADFIQKPIYAEELVHRFRQIFRERKLNAENVELKKHLLHRTRGDGMLGTSAPMVRLREEIGRVARTEATVLILGESGVGKELVADALHYSSSRANGPLIKLNCAAIPETLLEDELFGHERGAYTGAEGRRHGRFELADHGTLFLDEIGELPLNLQVKLLRLLQESTFERLGGSESIKSDVRVICATNQDLEGRVRDGTFREDLFYRINVVPLTVPPLRERRDDVLLLAQHFAREAGARNGRAVDKISPDAADILRAHSWNGNVRELSNVIERAVIMGSGPVLEPSDLSLSSLTHGARESRNGDPDGSLVQRLLTSQIPFEAFEAELLTMALKKTHGNQSRAARLLGMTRRTLQYRIDKFKIDTAAMRS